MRKGIMDKTKDKGIRTPHKYVDDFIAVIVVLAYIFQSISKPYEFAIHGVPDWAFALALIWTFGKKTVSGFKDFWKTIQEGQKEIVEEITSDEE